MITCMGKEGTKYLIHESEEGAKLDFKGKSKTQFKQVNTPKKPMKEIGFEMTIEDFQEGFPGFLWE